MNFIKLRNWLLKSRTAAGFRLRIGEDTQDVAVDGQTWADVARTIMSLKPNSIQALDGDERIMRAVDCVNLESVGADEDDEPSAAPTGKMQDLVIFGQLLADAYKSSHAFNKEAFDHLVDIVNAQSKRAEAVERERATEHRMLAKAYAAGAGAGDGAEEPGFLQQMFSSFVNGAGGIDKLASMFAADDPKPSNGKGTES